jgi:hypothetical protein
MDSAPNPGVEDGGGRCVHPDALGSPTIMSSISAAALNGRFWTLLVLERNGTD